MGGRSDGHHLMAYLEDTDLDSLPRRQPEFLQNSVTTRLYNEPCAQQGFTANSANVPQICLLLR